MLVGSGAFNYSGAMFCAHTGYVDLGEVLGVFYYICFICWCGEFVRDNAKI